jgi:two-component system, NarL family, invasion response regulator UvrY
MIGILMVEDHELLRQGAAQLLRGALGDVDIGEARTATQAEECLARGPWDLVILDLHLPDRSGLELLADLQRERPEQKVLVLSASSEEEVAARCLRLGARGFVTKASAATELLVAVRAVLGGGRHVSASLADLRGRELGGTEPAPPHEVLSPRELQVLRLIARGLTLREIGGELRLSEKTVATYRARIAEKLSISRVADLTRYALRHGMAG